MSVHLQRAMLLQEQGRYDLAIAEYRQTLADHPGQSFPHSMLALCLCEKEAFEEATAEARQAIHLEPDSPTGHSALGYVMLNRHYLKEAEAATHEAVRLDPEDPHHHAQLAAILLQKKQWQEALDACERALALDSEDVRAKNLRAMALVKLGRRIEAHQTIESALAKEPENATTQANQGWALLEAGQSEKAMEHFREALRLEPDSEWARMGIIEAMKSRNIIYRWLLYYFLWLQKLSGKAVWMFLIGLWGGNLLARWAANAYPALAPYATVLTSLYLGFVFMSWLGEPLFNLTLCTNRFGRLVLEKEKIFFSALIGATFFSGVGCFVWSILAESKPVGLLATNLTYLLILLTLPLKGVYVAEPGWQRKIMIGITAVLVMAGAGAISILAQWVYMEDRPVETEVRTFRLLRNIAFWGSALSTWGINILASITPKK